MVHVRYHNVVMKIRRIIKGVTRQFTTQFDYDEVMSAFVIVIKGACFHN